MRAIDYTRARTIEDAVSLLSQRGDRARVLVGGTDLIIQVREGRRDLDLFIDIKCIAEVNQLAFDADGNLLLGAAVPCYRICENADIAQNYPGLIDAVSLIGGVQIQSRASVGGNLCNGSPAADTVPALIALGAKCVIAGPEGRREVPVEEFCTAPGRTVLQRGEVLVALRIPRPSERSGAAYLRFIPRNEMDIAVVGAGVSVILDRDGHSFVAARVALGAVAPTPLLVPDAGAALVGRAVSDAVIEEAAAAARAATRPISDMRGSVDQRRHLAGVLTRRALRRAIERARETLVP